MASVVRSPQRTLRGRFSRFENYESFKKRFLQPNAPKGYELAPRYELNDRNQAVTLEGQVYSENLGLLGKSVFILIFRFLIAIAMESAGPLWRCGTLVANQVVQKYF